MSIRIVFRAAAMLVAVVFFSGCSVIGEIGDVIDAVLDVDEWFDDDDDSEEEGVVFETSWVAMAINLDARSEAPEVIFDSDEPSSYNAMINVSLCDSLGVVHPVELYFVKNDIDLWDYRAVVDGRDLGMVSSRGVEVSQPSTLWFDSGGELAGEAGGEITVTFEGAEPQSITLGFVTADDSHTTQLSSDMAFVSFEGDGCGGEPLVAELFIPDASL